MSVPITMVVYTDPADDPTIQEPDNGETILPGIFTDPADYMTIQEPDNGETTEL